jgi:hypothetical protein
MGLLDQHADRCVYPRPFPDDFDACPAFQATNFIAADSRNKPLGTWRTCGHLGTGDDLENRGRFYPRCGLGDQRQRWQWLAVRLQNASRPQALIPTPGLPAHASRASVRCER